MTKRLPLDFSGGNLFTRNRKQSITPKRKGETYESYM